MEDDDRGEIEIRLRLGKSCQYINLGYRFRIAQVGGKSLRRRLSVNRQEEKNGYSNSSLVFSRLFICNYSPCISSCISLLLSIKYFRNSKRIIKKCILLGRDDWRQRAFC